MDTRKVTLVATIAVIALVAVGIGYAYTAMTTNTDNNVAPEYITLVQGQDGAYQFADGSDRIYWDSNDKKDEVGYVTEYTITGTMVTNVITDYSVVKVGKEFTLIPQPNSGTNSKEGVKCDIIANNFTKANDGTDIFMVVKTAGANPQYFKLVENNYFQKGTYNNQQWTWTDGNIDIYQDGTTAYKSATVEMYYGYKTSETPSVKIYHAKGDVPAGPSENPIKNAALSFRINIKGANNHGSPELTGIGLSEQAVTLAFGDASHNHFDIEVSFNPVDAQNKNFTWSYDSNIVTLSGDETDTNRVVTAVALGETTITVRSAEGSYTASCVVTVDEYSLNVIFAANGGTGTMDQQLIKTSTVSKTLTENTFTYGTRDFAGWNTKEDGSGIAYSDQQEMTVAGFGQTLILYAQWSPIVTFEANGGSGNMDPQKVTYNTATNLSACTFTPPGTKTFKEWNTQADGQGTGYTSVTIKEDITLYAIWQGQ